MGGSAGNGLMKTDREVKHEVECQLQLQPAVDAMDIAGAERLRTKSDIGRVAAAEVSAAGGRPERQPCPTTSRPRAR